MSEMELAVLVTAAGWPLPEEMLAARRRIEELEAQNGKLQTKYHRVRENVRNISRVLRERRYTQKTQRFATLLTMAEQLTFAAGKLVQQTDDFTWIRMTRADYALYSEWQAERRRAK